MQVRILPLTHYNNGGSKMAVTGLGSGEYAISFPGGFTGEPESIKKTINSITKVNNGFIVEVGCQEFVFHTVKELTEAITLFYTDFDKAKAKYLEK